MFWVGLDFGCFCLYRLIVIVVEDGGYFDLKLFMLFGVGVVLLCGVGCIVNDLLDCDIDGKVRIVY